MIIIRSMVLLFTLLVATVAVSAAAPRSVNITLQDIIDTVEQSFGDSRTQARYAPPDGDLFLKTVTADFFQRSTIAKTQREMRAEGQLFLKNADYEQNEPLKFRFDYFRPTRHEVISDGASLWTWLPENRQVILSDVSFFYQTGLSDPARNRGFNFLQGLPRISRDFQITFSPQGRDIAGNYILELTPRRPMETIEKLFVVVRFDSAQRFAQINAGKGRMKRIIGNPASRREDMRDSRTGQYFNPEVIFPIVSTTVIDHKGNSTIMEFSNIQVNMTLSDLLFRFDIPADAQVLRPPGSR